MSQQFDSWTIKSDRKENIISALNCVRIYSKSKTKNNKVFLLFAVSIIDSFALRFAQHVYFHTIYNQVIGRQHTHTQRTRKSTPRTTTLKIEIYCFRFGRWAFVEYINAIKYVPSTKFIPKLFHFDCHLGVCCVARINGAEAAEAVVKENSDNLPVVCRSRDANPEPKMLCR